MNDDAGHSERSTRLATLLYEQKVTFGRYRKAAQPLTGIYWWIPTPGVLHGRIKWELVPFYGKFNEPVFHQDRWEDVLIRLAAVWGKPAEEFLTRLTGAYTGMPRGRVDGDSSGCVILGGKDDPGPVDMIRHMFNLQREVEYIYEPHERMVRAEFEAVKAALGLEYEGKQLVEDRGDLVNDPSSNVKFVSVERSMRRGQ